MERYKRFVEWTRILALFTAVFLAETVLKQLEESHIGPLAATVILGIAVIASLHFAELATVRLVETVPWIKKRVIGDQWIEGMWFDEVIGQNHFALVTIDIVAGEVKVSGEHCDVDGNVTATWESIVSCLEGSTLRTIYRSPQFVDRLGELTGYSTYVFTGLPGRPPNFYSGLFVDGSHDGRRCQLRGSRITDFLDLGDLADPAGRRTRLAGLIAKHRRAVAAHVTPQITKGATGQSVSSASTQAGD